ncbi:retrovirus-related pol polyprotein from transposon TNT 1-94 [Tanacetum coccineum]
MTTLAKHMIVAGANNRPPMLENTMYNSWQIRMLLYIKCKEQGRMMLKSVLEGPLVYPNIEVDGLTPDFYVVVNHNQVAKQIWDRVKLLMQGTKLSYQERECKLYNEFDKFDSIKGETLHEYYMRFAQIMNDIHIIGMAMQQVQVNTKFLNGLQPEWSKFITDVKLAKRMYTTNYDQLYAYLSQHEGHANEYQALVNHLPPSISQHAYQAPAITQQPQPEFPQLDLGLSVPSFLSGDDPIASLNKAMAFLSIAIASHFPTTNNQLRTSSNPRNQATIHDVRVIVHQVQGRQNVISEVPNSDNYQNNVVSDMCVQGESYSDQLTFNLNPNIDITSDSNIISYEQYLQETESAPVQNNNSSNQQNAMIILVFDAMSDQVAKCTADNLKHKELDASLTTELESYKEQVKQFEERQNVDLNNREKYIESQMNDMILKNASLITKINALRKQSKEKEDKYIEEAIDLEKQKKELENIVYKSFVDEYNETLELKAELAKKNDMIEKAVYTNFRNDVQDLKIGAFLLKLKLQQSKETKNVSIEKLKEHIANLKGKNVVDSVQIGHNSNVVTSKVYKLDLQPFSPRIKNNRDVNVDYLKVTQEHTYTLRDIVEQARALKPLDNALDFSLSSSIEASGSQPRSNTKKDRITQNSSGNKKKNKVEDQPTIAKSSLNNMNRVSKTVCNANVKHYVLNANSELICAFGHECMFVAIHDLCVRDYLNDVNAGVKYKSMKSRSAKVVQIVLCTLNQLAKQGLVRGLPKLKFEKDHICSACSLGKRKKSSHKPKDTNQEKLHLLHMDLCGPMCVESINGKKYIVVIIDDYTRFTWVKFLTSKDEAPEFIIKYLKQIQVRMNATVRNIRTDNETDEDLGKLKANAGISIFVGYAPVKKDYRIYNKCNRMIMETIHVTFDDLTAMAFEQFSSEPAP